MDVKSSELESITSCPHFTEKKTYYGLASVFTKSGMNLTDVEEPSFFAETIILISESLTLHFSRNKPYHSLIQIAWSGVIPSVLMNKTQWRLSNLKDSLFYKMVMFQIIH